MPELEVVILPVQHGSLRGDDLGQNGQRVPVRQHLLDVMVQPFS